MNIEEKLAGISARLEKIDAALTGLTEEIRGRSGNLVEETAEAVLDRLDEMMDLLYLVDEHLCDLIDREGERP